MLWSSSQIWRVVSLHFFPIWNQFEKREEKQFLECLLLLPCMPDWSYEYLVSTLLFFFTLFLWSQMKPKLQEVVILIVLFGRLLLAYMHAWYRPFRWPIPNSQYPHQGRWQRAQMSADRSICVFFSVRLSDTPQIELREQNTHQLSPSSLLFRSMV